MGRRIEPLGVSHATRGTKRRSVGRRATPVGCAARQAPSDGAARRAAASRYFVALVPDPDAARRAGALAGALAAAFGGRASPAADMHLTLAFIGPRPDSGAPAIAAALAGLARAPARAPMPLSVLGRFGRRGARGVCWAGPGATPEWLAGLARSVRERLTAAGIGFDARPLIPHCTLVRDCAADADALRVHEQALPIAVLRWRLAIGRSVAGTPAGEPRYRWRGIDARRVG